MSENLPATLTPEQFDLVRRTVAVGATPDELQLYLYDCKRRNVHPLDKLLHFTKRGGKYTPICSIDLMRSRAAETGDYAGNDDAIFTNADGQLAAKVTVYRMVAGAPRAFSATARWREYCPPSGQDHMWKKMPHVMLGKCAEALALRKAFPQQLAGLYEGAEMDQARDVSAMQEIPDDQPAAAAAPAAETRTISEKQQKRFFAIAKSRSDLDDVKAWMVSTYGIARTRDIPVSLYEAICTRLQNPAPLFDVQPPPEGGDMDEPGMEG